ncbi:SDR family NAD(P)-dependent oxidoreductase [Pseudomonas sp. NPDC090202]|uniref:SDR family NAD(P)-dependent oxidoreductase n=1 Tax=unclassified Pseudomonas TaxID=196821 RepID=UPI00382E11D4
MLRHKGTAVIVGAMSGRSLIYARRLAARGYDLILVAKQRERLQTVARRITDSSGRCVEVLAADLRQAEALAQIESLLMCDASIVLLVNHAETRDACLCRAAQRLGEALATGFAARQAGAVAHITGKAQYPLDDALWTERLMELENAGAMH